MLWHIESFDASIYQKFKFRCLDLSDVSVLGQAEKFAFDMIFNTTVVALLVVDEQARQQTATGRFCRGIVDVRPNIEEVVANAYLQHLTLFARSRSFIDPILPL